MTATLPLCIPADLLGVPHLFVSNEATPFYLQGVFISPLAERCGVTGTSTDGHCLAAVHAEDAFALRDMILLVEDKCFAAMCRKAGRKLTEPVPDAWVCALPGAIAASVDAQKGAIELLLIAQRDKPSAAEVAGWAKTAPNPKNVVGLLARTYAEEVDATFPEWRRVVPRTDPARASAESGAVNPAYLQTFIEAARAYETQIRIAVPADHAAPHFIDLGFKDFLGVIMPMQDWANGERYETPPWISTPSAAQAALRTEREDMQEAA